MKKETLQELIKTAVGNEPADLLIRNCRIIDVFNREIFEGNVAVKGDRIAGFAEPDAPAEQVIDAQGSYLVPGLINGHVHIESSHCSPREYARMVVPCGVTTAIADPHEICNVCGIQGLDYMLNASENIGMDVFFMVPSCVPATGFEHAGAVLDAEDIRKCLDHPRVLGLGEMMNAVGVCYLDDGVIDKIQASHEAGKRVDGHCPGLDSHMLDAYCSAGIISDHEAISGDELKSKIRRGLYIMLREGSACRNIYDLVKGLTPYNMERCLMCTDDRHPKSILEEGDIDNNIRVAIRAGVDPLDAIRMATLNAAVCYRLSDRGAIAPGYQADFLLVDDLKAFKPRMIFTKGRLAAENGKFLLDTKEYPMTGVDSCMNMQALSEDSFKLELKGNKIRCIDIIPGNIVTGEYIAEVGLNSDGSMICDNEKDICKIAVIERHHNTKYKAVAALHNYGIRHGAIGITIAHDSHNLIVAGDNDRDMLLVAEKIRSIGGGVAMAQDGEILASLPHPIAGIMTDSPGTEVAAQLDQIHDIARNKLHIRDGVDPLMTLSFMALPVIPKLKLTDSGLFDFTKFSFVPIEAE